MTRPTFVDLRSDVDNTYYQGPSNACVGFAAKSLIETMYDRSPTRRGERVSAWFMYYWGRKLANGTVKDTGMQPEWLQDAVQRHGVCRDELFNPFGDPNAVPPMPANLQAGSFLPCQFDFVPWVNDDAVLSYENSILEGKPVMLIIDPAPESFFNVPPGTPWREQNQTAWGRGVTAHAVAGIGFDSVARMMLCENSWGPQNGDGGFYGIPYDWLYGVNRRIFKMFRFNQMPVAAVPVEGYMPVIPTFTEGEVADILTAERVRRFQYLAEAGGPNADLQAIVSAGIAKNWSDRIFEIILQWPRGDFVKWLATQPQLNTTGLIREAI